MINLNNPAGLIRSVEQLSFNAQPCFLTIHYDGWILRIADGYTRRANSINPIYYSSLPLAQKIEWCEKIFSQLKQKTAFKITNHVCPPHLDQFLEERKYSTDALTSVQLCDLDKIKLQFFKDIKWKEKSDDDFLVSYAQLNHISTEKLAAVARMHRLISFPKIYAYKLVKEEVIACGLGVGERDYLGIFGVAVKPEFQGNGWGWKIMNSLLSWGKSNSCKYSYLQVFANNHPALRLYQKLNYHEQYKYWYRCK
ncbi:MAG: GNAT family N-acetyltransferase [bacterium]